ncbi:nuclear transport factor 2 family protein [Novosphingobium aerophilum]|uniref:Nuclear transport factor 2 family protein n=1 Tax=Novosphingobium aerophilum TaxID=2839843 RepID=A0A7X1KAP1_9SPHN|nr:nuclear transport factor 2 family protein [Novosphingobium aerophilum]MBC2650242.1 nuclear transport factor 2 family protein [Novosphingobium aerophilum]
MAPPSDDHAALRRTAEIYARGADRRCKDDWRAVLAEDVVIAGPGFTIEGQEANLGSIDFLALSYRATRHIVHAQWVEITGDRARGETVGTAEHRIAGADGTGDRLLCWAIRYQDEWRRDDGAWRFTRRDLIVDWEEVRPVHDVGGPVAAAHMEKETPQ